MLTVFNVDTRQIKRYERDLKAFAAQAFPYATKATLNEAAFHAQKEWRTQIGRKMIERNKYTRQSIQVDRARGNQVLLQQATVGSIAPYMHLQESGGTIGKEGREGVPITTSYAAGQGMKTQPRTRLATRMNRRKAIRLQKGKRKGANRAQRNLLAVREAAKSGQKHVYLKTARKQGIFRIIGKGRKAKPRLVHDLTEQSVSIPKRPTLAPAVAATGRQLPAFYARALRFQLRRRGLFRAYG